jgi:perosamine synthetase
MKVLKNKDIIDFIKGLYGNGEVQLHEPYIIHSQKEYICDCIDKNQIALGEYIEKFEEKIKEITGARYAIAMSSGTAALFMAIEVMFHHVQIFTTPFSFVATSNVAYYKNIKICYIDIDDNLNMSKDALINLLDRNEYKEIKQFKRNYTCLPVHVYGNSCDIEDIKNICDDYKVKLIEDAAQALGTYYNNKHVGTFGDIGIFSFNGNKIITTGGGGCLITDNRLYAERARHRINQSKLPHKWEYVHDEVGYNFRMPNINAALGYGQLRCLNFYLENKKMTTKLYKEFFEDSNIRFLDVSGNRKNNNWLNTIIFEDRKQRDSFLQEAHDNNIKVRPSWELLSNLNMYRDCWNDGLEKAKYYSERVVNLPSGVI